MIFVDLIRGLLDHEREAIDARQTQRAAVAAAIARAPDALPEAREIPLPRLEDWVRGCLSDRSTAVFTHTSTAVRELPNENFGAAGPVDVSVNGRKPVRSWFIVEMTEMAAAVFGDILGEDPQVVTESTLPSADRD